MSVFVCLASRHLHQTDGIIVKKTYGFWTWQVFGFIFVQHFIRSLIRKVTCDSDNDCVNVGDDCNEVVTDNDIDIDSLNTDEFDGGKDINYDTDTSSDNDNGIDAVHCLRSKQSRSTALIV